MKYGITIPLKKKNHCRSSDKTIFAFAPVLQRSKCVPAFASDASKLPYGEGFQREGRLKMTALPMPDVFCKDEVHLIYGLIIAYLTVQFNDELYCNTVILSPF
jgi:hypothetical protein